MDSNRILSVLLIEDDNEHAMIITRHLKRIDDARIHLTRASTLAEGRACLGSSRFDALLLDLRLPDSDIDQTLSQTLSHAAELPIIVLSSLEERSLARKALHEGAQDYLCKADLSPDLLYRAIDHAIERQNTEKRIREESDRKEALFELGQLALIEKDISTLLKKAASTIARALKVEFVKILEVQPEENSLRLVAGLGWKENLIGTLITDAKATSLACFTLEASRPQVSGDLKSMEPVVIDDLNTETRFLPSRLLKEHGVVSGISAIIHGKSLDMPYGVLGAHTSKKRKFVPDEAHFLQAAANVLAAAILRIQLEEALLHSLHARDEFLSIASHELKTPITSLKLQLQMTRRQLKPDEGLFPSPERLARALDVSFVQVDRLTALVEDLLDVARTQMGRLSFRRAKFDLGELIESTVAQFCEQFEAARCPIELRVEPGIVGEWDQSRIEQVLVNLLENALKYAPGTLIRVEAYRSDEQQAIITVEDQGSGIAPERQASIFQRFERATSSRNISGLGLGLYIVQQIVEGHGGTVSVQSDGKRGTKFTVNLPLSLRRLTQKNTTS